MGKEGRSENRKEEVRSKREEDKKSMPACCHS